MRFICQHVRDGRLYVCALVDLENGGVAYIQLTGVTPDPKAINPEYEDPGLESGAAFETEEEALAFLSENDLDMHVPYDE